MTSPYTEQWQPLPTEPITYVVEGLAIGNHAADPTGFDAVLTLNLTASYAAPPTTEMRRAWPGNALPTFLDEVVTFVEQVWSEGGRVLVRDFAGLNRCGLVAALVLVRSGLPVEDAIGAVVSQRGPYALCSELYLSHLRSQA